MTIGRLFIAGGVLLVLLTLVGVVKIALTAALVVGVILVAIGVLIG